MAAADGPVPVRALAQAARLRREARHLHRYGIEIGETTLDYGRLLARVREVVAEVAEHSVPRAELQDAGVVLHEHAGTARFVDPHTVEADHGTPPRTPTSSSCARAAPTGPCRCRARSWWARTATRGR